MALSTSEHNLLETACTNMNVAANTCRDVLEMLRDLGSTGVVDIAVHNNAATVHADATNLVHASGNMAFLGTKGSVAPDTSGWDNLYPLEINAGTSFSYFRLLTESRNETRVPSRLLLQRALTDADGLPQSFASALSTFSSESLVGSVRSVVKASDSGGEVGVDFYLCSKGNTGKAGQIRMSMPSHTGAVCNPFVCEYNAIYPLLTVTLGTSEHPFNTGYVSTAFTVTSDRREKNNIAEIGSQAVDFVKALRPVSFKMATGETTVEETDENENPVRMSVKPGVRQHWGFIAQEVREAMTVAGIEDAAVWCLSDKDDPDSMQSLRYEELIAPLVKAVQVLAAKIEALEGK